MDMVVKSEMKRHSVKKTKSNSILKVCGGILLLQSLHRGPSKQRFIAPYAQKSSTVSNLEMSRRLACHVLLLSFLKNHRDHLLGKSRGAICMNVTSP